MARGDSYDKYLARLDASDAERARVRDEKAAARQVVQAEWRRLLQDFVERMRALGLPPVDLPSRRPVKLPITRRRKGTRATRVGHIPMLIDREVVERASGIRGWGTGAHLAGRQGEDLVHHPVYVTTDARVVTPTRLERLSEGPAVHAGQQVRWYSPGWRFLEPPPETVDVRLPKEPGDGEDPEEQWTSVPFRDHLARVLQAAEHGDRPDPG